ncbi:MAG TPA: DUF192 domain-containing protein [Elusimicrobia bacterium]|nr:DUF192 domain-containing protein [Elusimicrobiota bacterium]
MIIFNLTKNLPVAAQALKADTFSSRLFGFIPRRSIGEEEGLWLAPCAMIHTCFMSFAIDAVFLDENLKTLRVVENLKPWRFSPWVCGAKSVLELRAGACAGRLAKGDQLAFRS